MTKKSSHKSESSPETKGEQAEPQAQTSAESHMGENYDHHRETLVKVHNMPGYVVDAAHERLGLSPMDILGLVTQFGPQVIQIITAIVNKVHPQPKPV